MSETKIIRTWDLARRLGVDRSTIWRWVRNSIIPPPIQIGPQVRGWRADDIERWLSERSGGAK